MNRQLILAVVLLSAVTGALARDVYVPPHVRRDGSYVEGHMRSTPDSQRSNNLGAQNNQYGGTNPYTGQRGTQRDELSSPPVYTAPRRNCSRDGFGNVTCF